MLRADSPVLVSTVRILPMTCSTFSTARRLVSDVAEALFAPSWAEAAAISAEEATSPTPDSVWRIASAFSSERENTVSIELLTSCMEATVSSESSARDCALFEKASERVRRGRSISSTFTRSRMSAWIISAISSFAFDRLIIQRSAGFTVKSSSLRRTSTRTTSRRGLTIDRTTSSMTIPATRTTPSAISDETTPTRCIASAMSAA